MSAPELLCKMIGFDIKNLSKKEILILEANFFSGVCMELNEHFRMKFKNYFCLMKFTLEMENKMLDANFISNLVNDILNSNEYSVQGIAYYTHTFEEVISDIASGINDAPSFPLGRKIIDLHKTVRPGLYREIMKKLLFNV
jgi:hypothetical protein